MIELSATVTVGEGSERHNHDLDYRHTLKHVHERENGVVELIPYEKSYAEQINDAVRPYIDRFNALVDERHQAAWGRYNRGEIKSKPRKANFKHMGYDYYSDHLEDTFFNPRTQKLEQMPMYRSIIIGIGDKEDRQQGRISETQAKRIFSDVVDKFKADFPDFLLLGATLHLDEEGFYHTHIDFKPMYERNIGQGLDFGVGMDSALEHMGYKPEQSIINGRDKAPLLFNAMRNKIYYELESAMASEGLRLQYGVSKVKDPGKDSSRNQRLEDWQATQDAAKSLQHKKNLALELIEKDEVTPNEIKQMSAFSVEIAALVDEIEKSPRSRFDKKKVVVEFRLFDQLKSLMNRILDFVAMLINELHYWQDQYSVLKEKDEKGVYLSKLDYKTMQAEQMHAVNKEVQKVKRFEAYLRSAGVPQHEIERIRENGGTSRGK